MMAAADPFADYEIVQPAGHGAATDPFADYKIVSPAPEGHTTLTGLAGSLTRGASPYAVGALAGAAAGAPFGGIGAIPGALAGAGAVGLTSLASNIYNPVARSTGLPEMATPQELTDKALDWIGTKRPSTATERVAEAVGAGAGSAAGLTGAAATVANKASGPIAKAVATQLAARPAAQALSGALAGGASQATGEAGGGPIARLAAGTVAGGLPFVPELVAASARGVPTDAAKQAADAGYVLPPTMASDDPSLVSEALSAPAGQVKTRQLASVKNQSVTNALAAKSLGLDEGTSLAEPDVFGDLRAEAGKAYAAIPKVLPTVTPDRAFLDDLKGLGGANSSAAQHFPSLVNNPAILDLSKTLATKGPFPTDAGMELIKQLRSDATGNLKAIGDPSAHALGLAQRQAATSIEDLIERNLEAVPELTQREAVTSAIPAAQQTASGDAVGDLRSSPMVQVPNKNAKDLMSWVRSKGGILDSNGDVAALYRANGLTPPPGIIANKNGTGLDVLAQDAQHDGYFGSNIAGSESDAPSEIGSDHMLNAISDHLNGKPSYSEFDAENIGAHETAKQFNEEIKNLAGQHGIDYRGMSADHFHRVVQERTDLLQKADSLGLELSGNENTAAIAAKIADHQAAHGIADPAEIEAMIDRRFGNSLPELRNELPWTDETAHASAETNAKPGTAARPGAAGGGPENLGAEAAGTSLDGQNATAGAATAVPGAHPATGADLVSRFRQARQLIAKSYDVQGATNPVTGDVNAVGLARLLKKGRPLTGDLKTIAEIATAFPKAVQNQAAFGGYQPLSALDFFGAGATALHSPKMAAAILARPAARSLILSPAYQRAMMNKTPLTLPGGAVGANVLAAGRKKGRQ